tara:strand:- start:8142 stop:9086 length:945 start_codon:yes stop_codon:yes gene_type:complete
MALGNYGIKRPADVSPQDVEILYHYKATRNANAGFVLGKLPSSVLRPHVHNTDTALGTTARINDEILGGLYDLTLPSAIFSNKGYYTVYVRPLEIRTKILDCGILESLPNVKGLVIDLNQVPLALQNHFVNHGLVGYRVEYLNKTRQEGGSGTKIPNFWRIVTSNFYCTRVANTESSVNKVSPRYAYTDSQSTLVFLTLTPSSAPTNKPNAVPDIGKAGQDIILTNTYFNPIVLDIEMVDHNFDTLAVGLYGNQTKSIEDGIYTMYDLSGQNNIYKQYNLFEIRDEFDEKLFEVRQDRGGSIDFSKQFGTIISQ